jgi:hydroxylamine dehydrogenase
MFDAAVWIMAFFLLTVLALLFGAYSCPVTAGQTSEATETCIGCHSSATPAIVADWKRSLHAGVTPSEALKKPELQRRISSEDIPENLKNVVVGCAECHTSNMDAHKDSFDHGDDKIHLTVTPKDCAVCHKTETEEFSENLMSHARVNLANNPIFSSLESSINGAYAFHGGKVKQSDPSPLTASDSCYACHGTALEVTGTYKKDTDYGEMEFPTLSGWPNIGVGRFNPDGTKGSCTACHSRHQFSITFARKAYACSQCHKGPDVPGFKAYEVSKHGNIFKSLSDEWNYKEVPWAAGRDFTAPTCATCHVSLVVNADGALLAKRTHKMSDRLPWRVLGLIYAHPHPKSPDTSIIRNKDGQPLPTTLTGEVAQEFLISPEEQKVRRENLQKVCSACHSQGWIAGHWERFEDSIKTSNELTKASTDIMRQAWAEKIADPKDGLFNESIERQWTKQWLLFPNSIRFGSAMMGADIGVFEQGRWDMTNGILDMMDHYKVLSTIKNKK